MFRIGACALVAAACPLSLPATAGAEIVLTRSGSPVTYATTDSGDQSEVTAARVEPGTSFSPRAPLSRAPAGQIYTFTSTEDFAAAVPAGCARAADAKSVTCTDANSVDADAGALSMYGRGGDDILSVTYVTAALQNGRYDSTLLDGGTGADTLSGSPGPDTLQASADASADTLIGRGGADTLICGDAGDLVTYDDGRTAGVTVSLTAGTGADGDTLGSLCDQVTGTPGADRLTADAGVNTLIGRAGNDTLIGAGAADAIAGDEGTDTVSCNDDFHNAQATGVTLALENGAGCDTGEVVNGIENAIGTAKNDTITVAGADNRVEGLAGDDTIVSKLATDDTILGGPGADSISDTGGSGDTLSYDDGRAGGVTVSLANLTGFPGDAGESITGTFENLVGSGNDDTLSGGIADARNTVLGLGGNDVIRGGLGGDTLDGGAGSDTLRYDGEGRTSGVTADLSDASGPDGDPGEVATAFENLAGTDLADTLTGSSAPNTIEAMAGADTANALSGDDLVLLKDNAGVDTSDCGPGSDTVMSDTGDVVSNCETVKATDPAPTATIAPGPTATTTPAPSVTTTPAPPPPRVTPKLAARFKVTPTSTKVVRLTVSGLPDRGGTVKVACKVSKAALRSCAFARETLTRAAAVPVPLKALFAGRRLAPGTRIGVTVTGAGVNRTKVGFKTRAGKSPERS